jgi:hypothetical protein
MHVFNHTPHIKKQIVKLVVAYHTTNILLRTIYRSIKPQNGPTFHEDVIWGLNVALGMVLDVFTHFSTHVIRNYLPIKIVSPCGQPDFAPWVSIPPKPHMLIDMPYVNLDGCPRHHCPFGLSSSLWEFPLLVLFGVHPQNIPTKYVYLQRHAILVLLSNPPFHAI